MREETDIPSVVRELRWYLGSLSSPIAKSHMGSAARMYYTRQNGSSVIVYAEGLGRKDRTPA